MGYTPQGIDNRAQAIFSLADFQRLYGGLASDSELGYAVAQFYQIAPGQQAYVVRVPKAGAKYASVTFSYLEFTALSSGQWANGQLLVDVDQGPPVNLAAAPVGDPLAFNLTITNLTGGTPEYFPNVTLNVNAMNYVGTIINDPDNGSQLVNVKVSGLPTPPTPPDPVPVSGVVGDAVTVSTVDTAVGGSATATAATGAWGLVIDTSAPAANTVPGLPVTVTVFTGGGSIPQSVGGLATQLQQSVNAALSVAVRGASVQCSVAPVSGGQAIRISASLPNQPDAVLAFSAPTGTGAPQDVRAALGLATPAYNVAHYALGTTNVQGKVTASGAGSDGTGLPGTGELIGDPGAFTGIYALQKVDLFNLLSIPDANRAVPSDPAALDSAVKPHDIYSAAIALCDQRRAFLLVDPPPNVTTIPGAVDWMTTSLAITDPNGAAYFPRPRLADPVNNYNLRAFAPSGVVAGVYAATDASRGVWKAPAGIAATLNGVQGMTYLMSDSENGLLNPVGVNCLRMFPVYGPVVWGARTLQGADAEASQWKYVPVRRTALYLEESLYRGTKWAVFEPNDAPLWAALRLNIEAFMQTLFLKGAFQGQTPDQAYFVKCDSETTTPADVDNGIVNILVGFAPLQPAEFVVIQIEQLTGQASS